MTDPSPSCAVKRKRTIIDGHTREMAKRVLDMCVEERNNKCLTLPLNDSFGRASMYTGLSKRVLANIRKEAMLGPLRTPCKKARPCNKRNNVNVENLDRTVIIRTIEDFYLTKNTIPSGPKILAAIKEKVTFPWATTSLRRVLKEMGYNWIPRRYGKGRILKEEPSMTLKRSTYLRTMLQYRKDDRNIFYYKTCLTNVTSDPLAMDSSSTSTIIIVHAAAGRGFLNESRLLFKTVSSSGEYSMSFERWATEILIPNLPPNSVVVMENAPNHIIEENKIPGKNCAKSTMLEWLARNDVKASDTMNKDDLYALIKSHWSHKDAEEKFEIDKCLMSLGHIVIELPLYICDINPVELAWNELKSIVPPDEKLDLSLKKLNEIELRLMQITAETWRVFDDQVIQLEKEYLERMALIEDAINRVEAEAVDDENNEADSDKSTSSESDDD